MAASAETLHLAADPFCADVARESRYAMWKTAVRPAQEHGILGVCAVNPTHYGMCCAA